MMNTVGKEELEKLKTFFAEHPDAAREFLAKNPEVLEYINKNSNQNVGNQMGESSTKGNTYGGKALAKSIPGIPRMFSWDENKNGFSNYLMLAVLAFSIQFIITLVCIFFYK